MRFLLSTCFCFAVLAAALVLPADLLHAQATYTITGFTSSGNDFVGAGETYVAEFQIDLSAPDIDSRPDRGEYPNAILSSSIVFSGGYVSQIDFAGGSITIQQDLAGGGVFIIDPSERGLILLADIYNPFQTDALFDEIEDQFRGDLSSLFSLEEPSGGIYSLSAGTSLDRRLSVLDPEPLLLGDMNLDGVVDFFDIDPFVNVLINDSYQDEADFDQNGTVDFFDIDPFVRALSLEQ